MNRRRGLFVLVIVIVVAIIAWVLFLNGGNEVKKDGATSSTGKTEQVLSKLQTQSKPMTYDIELAETKGLAENGHLSETFDQVYTMYRKVFENYLIGQLDISDFDQKLQDSSLGYSPVEESEQTIYQKDSSLDTTYIYLR